MLVKKSTSLDRQDPGRQLTRLYLLALSLVAVLTLAGHGLVRMALHGMADDSRVVNLAGRQRMLSQRLSKSALLEPAQGQPELLSILPEFRQAHRGLLHGDSSLGLPPQKSLQVRNLFAKLEPSFATLTEHATALATLPGVSPDRAQHVQGVLEAESAFLGVMESLVAQFEKESASRVHFLQRLDWLLLFVTLFVLLQEGVFIFRPAVGQIRRTILALQQARLELTERNSELKVALAVAQESATLKTQFVSNVSHEIRTPLQGILGTSSLLLHSHLSREQRRWADSLHASAEALTTVVDDILDFSKIEKGQLCLRNQPADLLICLEEALELFAPLAQQRGLDLLFRFPPEIPRHFVFDASRLRQIIMNLVSNAIKFTQSGYVLVEVSQLEAGALQIAIEDTGLGIDPIHHSRIFERFFQVDGHWDRHFGGTGLGLSIAAEITCLMQGELSLQSRLGEGSRFSLRLPLVASPELAEKTGSVPESEDGGFCSRRILVVDDHAINRLIFEEQLVALGMECQTAGDRLSALQLLDEAQVQGRHYDLVLLDRMMPGCDGLTLAREFKARCTNSTLPTMVLLSSSNHDLSSDQLLDCGIVACLSKPIRQCELTQFLRQNGTSKARPASHRQHVLLLHDDWFQLRLARAVLERMELRVHCVLRQSLTSEVVARGNYDWVISLEQPLTSRECLMCQGIAQSTVTLPVEAERVQALLEGSCQQALRPPWGLDAAKLSASWLDLQGRSVDEVLELMEQFSRVVEGLLADLRTCLRRGDGAGVQNKAKALLPLLKKFGASEAWICCHRLAEGQVGQADLCVSIDELAREICRYQSSIDRLWLEEA